MRTIAATAIMLLSFMGFANAAESYCSAGSFVTVYDGADTGTTWTVSAMGVRKIQIAGNTKPSRGCIFGFRAVGRTIRNEFVERPKLGVARFPNRTTLYYESAKAGDDNLAYRVFWEEWGSGKVVSAVIRLKIKVINGPV